MNCNCISELEEKVTEQLKSSGDFKKPVIKARMKDVVFSIANNKFTTRTATNFEVQLEGQKKKPLMPLFHSYCPFCGVSQKLEEQVEGS